MDAEREIDSYRTSNVGIGGTGSPITVLIRPKEPGHHSDSHEIYSLPEFFYNLHLVLLHPSSRIAEKTVALRP